MHVNRFGARGKFDGWEFSPGPVALRACRETYGRRCGNAIPVSDLVRRIVRCVGIAGFLAICPAHAEEPVKPLDNWKDLRAAFVRCWTVTKGTKGSVIAFRFLFAPNGGLRGPPMVMARILKGDADAKTRYEAAAYDTLDRCLPIRVTPGFKAVMGESLILLRLVNTPREPAANLGPAMTIFAEEAKAEGG